MGVCGHRPSAPSEIFNKQLLSQPQAFPSLLPAPSPCARSRCPSVPAVGGPGMSPPGAGPGWRDNAYSCWGWVSRGGSWAALGSRWEKRKLEHLSRSPTDTLSRRLPFSSRSQANRFPSVISVCHWGTWGDSPNPPYPLGIFCASPEPGRVQLL